MGLRMCQSRLEAEQVVLPSVGGLMNHNFYHIITRISIKFGMNVVPLEAALILFFLVLCTWL